MTLSDFIIMLVLFVCLCICVYVPCECRCPEGPQEAFGSPGTGAMRGYKSPHVGNEN